MTFVGQAIPQGKIIPTLSTIGLMALVALLGLVGYVLIGRGSSGA